ncbi:MAG TPA: HNH endonuclease [Candidatus Limnocylindrales bacterium]|jgi:5-methylcytosine-specific restriction endonuclease McrA|nr:HNH endonuclease [Candidatus Limnocylindrales bacterium]
MTKILSRSPRRRLELHRLVLERDGWRCQLCGSMQHLQVHHLKFRSQAGSDEEPNLITLCAECHERTHRSSSRYEYGGRS